MDIKKFVESWYLFVVNHSGGKDSQAMMLLIEQLVPREQIMVVHAALGGGWTTVQCCDCGEKVFGNNLHHAIQRWNALEKEKNSVNN